MDCNRNISTYCRLLPKIELHAHLNGSLSDSTLKQLGAEPTAVSNLTLDKCFDVFKIAQAVTNTKEKVYVATRSVIEDFAADRVIYLELRTTPRGNELMSARDYVDSVVQAIKDSSKDILVKLLLSVDRGQGETVRSTLDVIYEMYEKYPEIVVGIDFSGDPKKGCFKEDLFRDARRKGLKVALHCGEIVQNDEVAQMLEFGPDRLGHCTTLHPKYGGTKENWEQYRNLRIPTEMCLTSNVICQTTKTYPEHHLKEWLTSNLPFAICTDDKGVFSTSLSEELTHAAENFCLLEKDLWNITFRSIDFAFASNREKEELNTKLREFSVLWKSMQN